MDPFVARVVRLAAIGLAALFVLALGAGTVFLASFDANAYKPRLIAAVRGATGRELRLAGPVRLSLSLRPTLEIDGASLGNPPGFSRPDMATLKRLVLQVSLPALLFGRVEILRLVLVEPDLLLEAGGTAPNWVMTPGGGAAGTKIGGAAGTQSGGATGAVPEIGVLDVRIEGGQVAFRDATGAVTTVANALIEASAAGPGAPMRVSAQGSLGGKPVTLAAVLAVGGAELALKQIVIGLPQGEVTGELALSTGARPMLRGTVAARTVDADALPAGGGGAAGETGLPVAALRGVDADLGMTVGEVRRAGTVYRDIAAHLALAAGRADLKDITATIPGGQIAGRAVLDAAGAVPHAALSLSGPALALAPLLAAYGMPGEATGTLEARAEVQTTGATPRAMLAGLEGAVGLAVAGGTVDARRVGGLLGAVLQRADFGQSGTMADLRCFAGRMDIKAGVGTVSVLRLDSPVLTVTGEGRVDLRTQALALLVKAQARIAGVDVVLPVDIGGVVAAPLVRADAVAAVTDNAGTAARLALGAATGGTTGLLGVLGIGAATGAGTDPCAAALKRARGLPAVKM